MAWAGSVECICSCGAPGISSLLQRLNTAVRLTQLRHSPPDQAQTDRLRPLVLRLQDMLRDKLTDLNNRRDHLKVNILKHIGREMNRNSLTIYMYISLCT